MVIRVKCLYIRSQSESFLHLHLFIVAFAFICFALLQILQTGHLLGCLPMNGRELVQAFFPVLNSSSFLLLLYLFFFFFISSCSCSFPYSCSSSFSSSSNS